MKYFVISWIFLIFFSCKTQFKTQEYNEGNIPKTPNYAQSSNWAVLPGKYPKVLNAYVAKDIDALEADVFYVYPTLILDPLDPSWNASVEDKNHREKVVNSAVQFQASAWGKAGRLYVPYYRQAHIRSYDYYSSGGEKAFSLAYSDVKASFEYYLANYNKGRPIIIASHSQGTTHTKRLLQDFFDGTPLQKKLVAAYLVGIEVLPNTFKHLKPMNKPKQTGGYLCWNTFKKGHFPKKKDLYKGSLTTNPISWNNDLETDFEDHKGFLFTNGKIYEKSIRISITDGLVWSSLPRFPMRIFMIFKKNYHVADVNLFWKDISDNSQLRVANWIEK